MIAVTTVGGAWHAKLWRERGIPALLVGVVSAGYAAARAYHEPSWPTDFDQLWHAARAMSAGSNPYDAVGPGRAFQWDWPLFYPVPALLPALAFQHLSVAVARVWFSALLGVTLGYAMGSRLRTHWPLLLSSFFLIAVSRNQWSPALLAALWHPSASVTVAAKPNLGLAVLGALRGRALLHALLGASAALVVSLILRPSWPMEWLAVTAGAPQKLAPILQPGGFFLTLAALRYRRAEGRLLLAVALIPQTPSLYDLLLLFFICRSRLEAIAMAVLSHMLFWGFISFGGGETFDAYASALGRTAIWVVYLPSLLVVLRRPNRWVDDPALEYSDLSSRRDDGLAANLERVLLVPLAIAAFFLVWLPLVTRR